MYCLQSCESLVFENGGMAAGLMQLALLRLARHRCRGWTIKRQSFACPLLTAQWLSQRPGTDRDACVQIRRIRPDCGDPGSCVHPTVWCEPSVGPCEPTGRSRPQQSRAAKGVVCTDAFSLDTVLPAALIDLPATYFDLSAASTSTGTVGRCHGCLACWRTSQLLHCTQYQYHASSVGTSATPGSPAATWTTAAQTSPCAQVTMPYHVRVLIPCYREPLQIVVKTINAAYDAVLPAGCHRTIYVCDDGKDPKLRRFCRAMGPSVVYVSGRRRAAGEMNGKSGNLNNCLTQIYPEGEPVPYNEVICIFDADQVPPCLLRSSACLQLLPEWLLSLMSRESAAVHTSWPAGCSDVCCPQLEQCSSVSCPGAWRQPLPAEWPARCWNARTSERPCPSQFGTQRRASPERSTPSSG